jgi:excisionase family DNA binding protein
MNKTDSNHSGDREELLFVSEVADRLRRSIDAVRWLINTKQLRAGKLGGRVVVRRGDLDAFISAAFKDAP